MKKILLLLTFSISLFASSISSSEASNYIGLEKTVCGKVVGTYYAKSSNGAPTFLNFDLPYPNQLFTAVIFERSRNSFSGNPESMFKYKNICVTGYIDEYKGVPQIIVENSSQIK
ncbi:DNA-binding protein [Arcobacter arenosus]|uniref:DNA-binding protein n=1 Tax=Arcobacter arenosus TaxID=2576037 RepID=A0A5R8XY85_9BACT|nr:DNA-binding protein [Arcobacter arenosus]TLP36221.1 DNA-binding protein [Arcobacter arenosus]